MLTHERDLETVTQKEAPKHGKAEPRPRPATR